MGMAAGQARLLSITSRLADNELRAQIINNNKMRLATESSQVSEAYVQALNDAQLMFTNYGADNSVNYQQLTFNAMTAYNPYNNQYILRNNAGNILVSEKDAKNYEEVKNKPNALELFLGKYGLEYTTNYFGKLQTGANVLAEFGNNTGSINNDNVYFYGGDLDGNGFISAGDYQDSGFDQDGIKALYEDGSTVNFLGGNSITVESYADTLASDDYYDYFAALDKYTEKQNVYYQCVADLMDAKLDEVVADTTGDDNFEAFKNVLNSSTTASTNADKYIINNLGLLIDVLKEANSYTTTDYSDDKSFNNSKRDPFIDTLIKRAEAYVNGTAGTADLNEDGTAEDVLNITSTVNNETGKGKIDFTSTNDPIITVTDANDSTIKYTGFKVHDTKNNNDYLVVPDNTTAPTSYTIYDLSEDCKETSTESKLSNTVASFTYDATPGAEEWSLSVNKQVSLKDVQAEAVAILEALKNSIYKIWDPTNSDLRNISGVSQDVIDRVNKAYSDYLEAAAELGNCIYGTGSYKLEDTNNDTYYDKITPNGDYPEIVYLDNISLLYNATATGGHNYDADGDGTPELHEYEKFDDSFYNVYKNILLDNIFASNGEPLYAWIDTKNGDENGEAKYNWYKNLFEQMSKGYETVTNGLASSPEWMKFAFESGMVTIEQQDSYGNWNRTIYTNCSDITEQTNDKAIAIAEAEYNAAMNKIENKDKRYDLELKNIDTEHNSLQTEYDSIKTAINKNIERTFKIYS